MFTPLLAKISEYFPEHDKTCLKNVLTLSLCMLIKETVNLNKLKGTVGAVLGRSNTQADSNYKRLIRIFDHHSDSTLWLDLLTFVFTFLGLRGDYLILDGTSWRSGKRKFHFLTLCVVHQGIAIPIFWLNLQKIGHSSTEERILLIKGALRRFDLAYAVLIADREYIGTVWFKYLLDNEIDFIIRLKSGTYKEAVDQAEGRSYEGLRGKVKRSKVASKILSKPFVLKDMLLNFIVLKNRKQDAEEPLVYLVTNLQQPARTIADKYAMRWKIEAFFKHMKTNGFSIEDMNLGTQTRCRLLMAIVVFSYVLSIKEGLKTYRKVRMKLYSDGSEEMGESVFRRGINSLMRFCANLYTFCLYVFGKIRNNKMPVPILILENV
jgi:hypothetical protein